MGNGISKETYMKIEDPALRDEMLLDLQFNTHDTVVKLEKIVTPLKKDIIWLTWGFRIIFGSLIGLVFILLRTLTS